MGKGCAVAVVAASLPNVALSGFTTGLIGERGRVIPGGNRKRSGTGRGRITFRPGARRSSSTTRNPGKSILPIPVQHDAIWLLLKDDYFVQLVDDGAYGDVGCNGLEGDVGVLRGHGYSFHKQSHETIDVKYCNNRLPHIL